MSKYTHTLKFKCKSREIANHLFMFRLPHNARYLTMFEWDHDVIGNYSGMPENYLFIEIKKKINIFWNSCLIIKWSLSVGWLKNDWRKTIVSTAQLNWMVFVNHSIYSQNTIWWIELRHRKKERKKVIGERKKKTGICQNSRPNWR